MSNHIILRSEDLYVTWGVLGWWGKGELQLVIKTQDYHPGRRCPVWNHFHADLIQLTLHITEVKLEGCMYPHLKYQHVVSTVLQQREQLARVNTVSDMNETEGREDRCHRRKPHHSVSSGQRHSSRADQKDASCPCVLFLSIVSWPPTADIKRIRVISVREYQQTPSCSCRLISFCSTAWCKTWQHIEPTLQAEGMIGRQCFHAHGGKQWIHGGLFLGKVFQIR